MDTAQPDSNPKIQDPQPQPGNPQPGDPLPGPDQPIHDPPVIPERDRGNQVVFDEEQTAR
jgi:hypothetical protein